MPPLNPEVAAVYAEALRIMQQREQKFKGLWRSNSLEEGNLHIGSKYKRFTADPKHNLDDGLDLLNYIAFQIVNVREGRV